MTSFHRSYLWYLFFFSGKKICCVDISDTGLIAVKVPLQFEYGVKIILGGFYCHLLVLNSSPWIMTPLDSSWLTLWGAMQKWPLPCSSWEQTSRCENLQTETWQPLKVGWVCWRVNSSMPATPSHIRLRGCGSSCCQTSTYQKLWKKKMLWQQPQYWMRGRRKVSKEV